jgi:hypothetical protein
MDEETVDLSIRKCLGLSDTCPSHDTDVSTEPT